MRVSVVAHLTRLFLFALFGVVLAFMDLWITGWEFWVLLLMITAASVLSDIEGEWRYKEWSERKK